MAAAEAAEPVPFALTALGRRGPVLWAVNRQAGAQGLNPGMRLADARALVAGLVTAGAEPERDRRGLERLALWCNRFTPLCAVDSNDGGGDGDGSDDHGLLLDIAGCAHLFGGEAALVEEIAARLAGLGVEARLGLADTPGAAWALARFGPADARIAAPSATRAAIAALPVEALRLAADDARLLRRLGLVTVGAVDGLPRASLARRFASGERRGAVLARLDRALGRCAAPLVPVAPPPACLERLALPEPLIDRDGLDAALARLMAGAERGAGARRAGRAVPRIVVLPGRRQRGPACGVHGARDTGRRSPAAPLRGDARDRGIPASASITRRSTVCASSRSRRRSFPSPAAGGGRAAWTSWSTACWRASAPAPSAAWSRSPATGRRRPSGRWRPAGSRHHGPRRPKRPSGPFRLFDRPEPIEVMAEVPDGPPLLFTWRRARRRVMRAAGPERIEPEWWVGAGGGGRDEAVRDYYRVEDADGRRYWLYRAGLYGDTGSGTGTARPPRWYVHGLYG